MPHRTSSALRCFVTTVVVAALALGTAGPVSAADAADETGTLTGRVLGEGDGGPDADIDSVYVDLIDPDRPGYDTGYFDESTDGTFTIAGVEPGDYQVKYTPNDSVHLARWLGGTREPSATVAVVADERTATPLQVLPLGGTISGVVTYGGPDAPSPTSITVNAGWYAYYWGGEATPDEDGRYTIRGLELQDYHVSFEGIPAYVPEYWNGAPDQRTAQVTTVTETGQAIFGRDAVLEKGGSLSGRVTAADTGQGLNQVPVTAHRVADVADPEHYPEGYDGFALVTTDAEGHYEMEGLRAGTWRIEADAREVTLRNQLDVLPIDQWYGGTADESKARGVAVSTGGARSGIDIAMPSVPALHGLVATREFLESYTDVTVTAEQVCSDAPCLTRSVEVDSAVGNEYAFTDLPAGQYRIRYDTATDPDEGAEAARYLSGYWIGDRTRQDATVVDYPAGGTVTANIMLTEEDAPRFFTDVEPRSTFGREVTWMAGKNLAQGYVEADGSKTYHPVEDVSRQAMAAFLYRYDRYRFWPTEFVPPATASFSDVPVTHPFFTEIEWMKSEGLTTGNADGTFAPLEPVTRQSAAAFLSRLSGEPHPVSTVFTDVPAANPFAGEIAWLDRTGITTGYPDGGFHPLEPVSRQAIAAFLYRYDATQ